MGRDAPDWGHTVDAERLLRQHNWLFPGNNHQHLYHPDTADRPPCRRRNVPLGNGMLPEQLLIPQRARPAIVSRALWRRRRVDTGGSRRCAVSAPPARPADQRPAPDWAWVLRDDVGAIAIG